MPQLLNSSNSFYYNSSLVLEHLFGKGISTAFYSLVKKRIEENISEKLRTRTYGRRTEVDRRSDLSIQEFKENYLKKGIPVVFEGAGNSWACCREWSHEMFKTRYGSDQIVIFNTSKNQEGKLEYKNSSLGETIENILTSNGTSIRFNPLLYRHPELMQNIDLDWFVKRISSSRYVFQTFNLLPRISSLQNVELPLIYGGVSLESRRERAKKVLEQVGLGDRMDHKPNELSGGQRQRVAVARALANKPSIILADEPTGNLDSKTGEDIMLLFNELHEAGNTIILVTHEEYIAENAHRIVRLHDGIIASDEVVQMHTMN